MKAVTFAIFETYVSISLSKGRINEPLERLIPLCTAPISLLTPLLSRKGVDRHVLHPWQMVRPASSPLHLPHKRGASPGQQNMPEIHATPLKSHPPSVQAPRQTMRAHESTSAGLFFSAFVSPRGCKGVSDTILKSDIKLKWCENYILIFIIYSSTGEEDAIGSSRSSIIIISVIVAGTDIKVGDVASVC